MEIIFLNQCHFCVFYVMLKLRLVTVEQTYSSTYNYYLCRYIFKDTQMGCNSLNLY